MQLGKDTNSRMIVLSDASAGALRSTLSTTIDTHKRAPKGTQTTGSKSYSKIVKEGIKNSAHVTQTRPSPTLLKGMSDKSPLSNKSVNGDVTTRRVEKASIQGHPATVVNAPTPQFTSAPLPATDRLCIPIGRPLPMIAAHQTEIPSPEYISSFLHGFTERVIPSSIRLAGPDCNVHAWMYWVLATVADPRTEQAKGLLHDNPASVLFAAQMQLATACSREIEEMAQRAASRDYYYDFLIRACGHATAKEWISGRGGGIGRKKLTVKGSSSGGGLCLRKRVLIGQGFKAYNEMVKRQLGEDPVSSEV